MTTLRRVLPLRLPGTAGRSRGCQGRSRAFLAAFPPAVIFDEAQYAPDLFPHIKERVDERRHTAGQYLLTGSQTL